MTKMPTRPLSPREPVGLHMIARLAGVSVSTVSRALAGSSVVSDRTRLRVRELADQYGYQPNIAARNLRLGRTNTIGVVLAMEQGGDQHLSDPFCIALLGHLADALADRGLDLLLSKVPAGDSDWLDRLVDSGRVDGAILIGRPDRTDALDRVAGRYGALAVWGAPLEGQRYASVGTDDLRGGRIATEHLIEQGRHCLLFLGDPACPETALRYQGFRAASDAAGVEGRLLALRTRAGDATPAIADLLHRHPEIDGIVAESDLGAITAIRVLAGMGRAVPADVSVTGYDDSPLAQHMTPPLTTIRQDLHRAAVALVEMLLRQLGGQSPEAVVFPPLLVARGSA